MRHGPTNIKYLSILKGEAKSVSETFMYSNYMMRQSAREDFTAYNVFTPGVHYAKPILKHSRNQTFSTRPLASRIQQTHINHVTQNDITSVFNASSKIPAIAPYALLLSPLTITF